MRNPHRKTLIKKEKWPLIDGWYWCPLHLIDQRVLKLEPQRTQGRASLWRWLRWKSRQYDLPRRIAHNCDDGKIRAPIDAEYYEKKRGGVSIYGRCQKCDVPISDGLKFIIIMEYTDTP